MNGSGLGYQENSALDVNAQYTVTVPDLEFAKAQVKATTAATFVKVGGRRAERGQGDDDLRGQQARLRGQRASSRSATSTRSGDVVFHPDHQEIHLPSLGAPDARASSGAPRRAARPRCTYGNDRGRAAGREAGERRPVARRQRRVRAEGPRPRRTALSVQARNVDIAQIEKLALQNRGLTGTVDAHCDRSRAPADAPVVSGNRRR